MEDERLDAKAESRNIGSELRNMQVELALLKDKITLSRDTAVMFETFADVESLHDTGKKKCRGSQASLPEEFQSGRS